MKNLNTYINEKLIIDKDVSVSHFTIGKKILPILLYFVPNEVKTKLVLIEPTEIIELKDDVITFKDNSWFGRTIKEKIYKNDKKYYEYNEDFTSACIILNKKDGLDFLNEYLNIRKNSSPNNIFEVLKNEYFSEKDESLFNKKRKEIIDGVKTVKKYILMLK